MQIYIEQKGDKFFCAKKKKRYFVQNDFKARLRGKKLLFTYLSASNIIIKHDNKV